MGAVSRRRGDRRVGVRGIYLGNYVRWDANEHVKLVMEKYGWRPAQQPFERTYRRSRTSTTCTRTASTTT